MLVYACPLGSSSCTRGIGYEARPIAEMQCSLALALTPILLYYSIQQLPNDYATLLPHPFRLGSGARGSTIHGLDGSRLASPRRADAAEATGDAHGVHYPGGPQSAGREASAADADRAWLASREAGAATDLPTGNSHTELNEMDSPMTSVRHLGFLARERDLPEATVCAYVKR